MAANARLAAKNQLTKNTQKKSGVSKNTRYQGFRNNINSRIEVLKEDPTAPDPNAPPKLYNPYFNFSSGIEILKENPNVPDPNAASKP